MSSPGRSAAVRESRSRLANLRAGLDSVQPGSIAPGASPLTTRSFWATPTPWLWNSCAFRHGNSRRSASSCGASRPQYSPEHKKSLLMTNRHGGDRRCRASGQSSPPLPPGPEPRRLLQEVSHGRLYQTRNTDYNRLRGSTSTTQFRGSPSPFSTASRALRIPSAMRARLFPFRRIWNRCCPLSLDKGAEAGPSTV